MGSSQSSHANAKIKEHVPSSSESVGGRKSPTSDIHVTPKTRSVEKDSLFVYTSDSEESDCLEDENDEEIESGLTERRMILEDAKMLKAYAVFHLHPERPVDTADASAFGRNYFSRASADDFYEEEESEEREQILQECALLKKYAGFHLHPEKPVEMEDATMFSRSYYSRTSAPEQETVEEAEERAIILEEAATLKKYAEFHLHPEKHVVTSDASAYGRSYFSRASADEFYGAEESKEREQILQDCVELKKYAGFHLHPEKPVEMEDATMFSRSYYSRPSAPAQETVEEAEERAIILEEAATLKKYAEFHLHPEKHVVTSDASAYGRNYFSRASADEFYGEESEEREQILQDCAELKKYAGFHLHPEKPVEMEDATMFSRSYYSRPSAPAQETVEETEERAIILEEAATLKKYAEFHLHPEKPVDSTAASVYGRNYFNRFTAYLNAEADSKPANTDVASDKQSTKPDEIKSFQTVKQSSIDGNKEETMNRSPSSIMLFGYEDNEAF